MATVYRLKYRNGRVEDLVDSRDYFYVLGLDDLLRVPTIPAWCHRCDTTVLAEELQSSAQLEKELRENEATDSGRYQRYFGPLPPGRRAESVASEQRRLKRYLSHALMRKSPPHCLCCGETKVSFFPLRVWAPHPKTGEEIFFEPCGVGSTEAHVRFFDAEGRSITVSAAEQKLYLSILHRRNDL